MQRGTRTADSSRACKQVDTGVVGTVANTVNGGVCTVASGSTPSAVVVGLFWRLAQQVLYRNTYKSKCATDRKKKIVSYTNFKMCAVRQRSVSILIT